MPGGDIASAYIALMPSMRGFGSSVVQQGGPQIAAAGRQLGEKGGVALGTALGGATAKSAVPAINEVNRSIAAAQSSSQGWLGSTASMAVKNVGLYGSMYVAIQGIRRGLDAVFDSMIGFNAELEQAQIGFTTLTGSSSAAKTEMAWIKDFAKESPFRYEDLVGYSQQLLAFKFNAEQAHEVIIASGNAAAALGRGEEGIARINLALGQMWTKGKIQSQEMLQLTEAGIGAWQILAEAYGVSVAEVQDAVTDGLISAKDAVPALVKGMEEQFGGLMEAQSKTFSGVVSNIQDTLQQEFAEAGEPLFHELQSQAQELLASLDDPQAVEMMHQLGEGLATGAHALGDFLKFAWQWRDVIRAVGVGYGALKLTSSWTASHFSAEAVAAREAGMRWQQVIPALTGVRAATLQSAAADARYQAAMAASSQASKVAQASMQARTAAADAHRAAVDRVILTERISLSLPFDRAYAARTSAQNALTAAANAETAAIERSTVAKRAATAADQAFAAAETRAAAASASLAAAQSARGAGLSKLGPIASTAGMLVGAPLAMDGFSRSAENATAASQDLGQASLGMAEAIGGAALAGAALAGAALGSILPGVGTAIGAIGGAVVGAAGNIWSMQAALDAANKDVSAIKDALTAMGVEATLADLAVQGVTNENLAAVGGFDALRKALQAGTYSEFLDDTKKQIQANRELAQSLEERASEYRDGDDTYALRERATQLWESSKALESAVSAPGTNSDNLSLVQEQVTYSAYQAAYAADMQSGALGRTTEAAWQAVAAEGGLGVEALQAAVRMEGLAGVAGYATQMISGIPKGTPINFSTNAAEIASKIAVLAATLDAVYAAQGDNASGRTVSLEARIKALQAQLASVLTSPVTTLSIPSGPGKSKSGGGGSNAAADAARKAAEEAARQLEQDKKAQLAFADAFTSIMGYALEGNFEQYKDRLADEIKSLTEQGYKQAADQLKEQSKALTRAAQDYSVLTNKLKTASDAYDDLTKRMQDQYTASRDLILGLGKLTDAQSYDQLAYLLGETTSAATQYQDVLTQLKEQGLSEELWNQLAQAGPESMALAQSILEQGQAGIDQLNSLSGGLVDAADAMGDLVSTSMYQAGVYAMKAYIEGLKSEATALEAQLETIANNILNKVAVAITPGNAGYGLISAGPQTVTNTYQMSIAADSLGDLKSIQDFLHMLESAPTTQLVNQAGTVTS